MTVMASTDYLGYASFYKRDNDALEINPPIAVNNITTDGSNADWAICALHALLFLVVCAWTYKTHPGRRVFHYFAQMILLVATIYYFVMASNLGAHAVPVQFRAGSIPGRTRQIFYTRWIGYFINFSLIWFSLQLLSGVGWASILFTTGLAMLWALMFLVGALVSSSYKWGFWTIAVVIYFLLAWQTMGVARKHARRVSVEASKIFTMLAGWELFMMLLYPIAWGVSEGGNKISMDSEQAFYCTLDVLSQGAFAVALLYLTRRLDFDAHRLGFSEYGRLHDPVHGEKHHHSGVTGGHNGGTAGTVPATTV